MQNNALATHLFPFKTTNIVKLEKLLSAEVLLWLLGVLAQYLKDAHHLPFSCMHVIQNLALSVDTSVASFNPSLRVIGW